MSETVTLPTEEDAEAQAVAAANVGYARRAGKAATAAETAQAAVQQPAEPPLADPAPAPESTDPAAPESNLSAEQAPQPIDPNPLLTQYFEDLKAEVRAMKQSGVDAKTVQTLAGAVGDINRQLKELAAAKKEDAPAAETRLAAALKRAKEKASEYPDIGLPMLEALEELAAEVAGKKTQQEPTPAPPAWTPAQRQPAADFEAETQKRVAAKAREDLLEIHPDYYAVRNSGEFNAWFKAKPADYQTKAQSSWNPLVAAEPVSAFKAWQAAQRRKTDRLEAAAPERGTGGGGQPTTLPDEAGFARGYARRKRTA